MNTPEPDLPLTKPDADTNLGRSVEPSRAEGRPTAAGGTPPQPADTGEWRSQKPSQLETVPPRDPAPGWLQLLFALYGVLLIVSFGASCMHTGREIPLLYFVAKLIFVLGIMLGLFVIAWQIANPRSFVGICRSIGVAAFIFMAGALSAVLIAFNNSDKRWMIT